MITITCLNIFTTEPKGTIYRPCLLVPVMLLCMAVSFAFPTRLALADDDGSGPELEEAQGAMLIDSGGNVLYEHNADELFPPASTTKVMTAMVALDSGHPLDEDVEIVEEDLGDGGQLADYGSGDHVTFGELMQVMLVYSGNDAAYNIAVTVAGSEEKFADLMNQKAKAIGMDNTHFVNSHGMDVDDHYSCARDLATMGRYAMQHYPFICNTVTMGEVETTVRGYPTTLMATDRLLGTFEGIRGVKSGAVAEGYSFVGASGRGDIQLYSGVIGCKTPSGRFDDTAKLMEWGYEQFGDMSISNPDWTIRLQPYADDLGLKATVGATDTVHCPLWPGGNSVSYKSVLVRSGQLVATNDLCGWTVWNQSGRRMGGSLYGTQAYPVRVSSWPLFSLPLFEDVSALGRELSHGE